MTWAERYFPALSTLTTKRRLFRLATINFAVLFAFIPVVLGVIGLFSVRTYFLVSFVWLLISSEILAPSDHDSAWWTRLLWIRAGGWIVFALIIFERIVAVTQ